MVLNLKEVALHPIALISFVIFLFTTPLSYLSNNPSFTKPLQVSEDSLETLRLTWVGDLMCHSVQFQYAHVEADSYNFIPSYRYIQSYLEKSDFVFGNLETVTAGKKAGYSGYPFFNTPDDYVTALKLVGFDMVSTVNNHCLDRGEKGLLRTIETLINENISYVGTYLSQQDHDSIRVIDLKGIKVSIIAYTYGTNGNRIPPSKPYSVNLIDKKLMSEDIRRAREKSDIVAVYLHFGDEYKREPNDYQKEIVQFLIDKGVDLIIGSHPHVIQPLEVKKSVIGKLDSVFIAYSLGNFISNQRWRYSDASVILTVVLQKNLNSGRLTIKDVEFLPLWVFKGYIGKQKGYFLISPEIVTSDSVNNFLSKNDKKLAIEAFTDTREILSRYGYSPIEVNLSRDF